MIEHPTRVTETTASLLDVVLTSSPRNISDCGALHLGISDHSLIYACRKITVARSKPKIVETRNFKSYIPYNFNTELYSTLEMCNWKTNDPNVFWDQFKTTFNNIADIHAPIRCRSEYAPWLNNDIKKTMNRRDYLKKKAIKTNSNIYHRAYKTERNRVNKEIKRAKRDYYQECIDKNRSNPKLMWKHINQLICKGSKTTQISSLKVGEETISDEHVIADALNTYFTNIGPQLSNQIPDTNIGIEEYMNSKIDAKFTFKNIYLDDVLKEFEKLNTSKSFGPDKISARLLEDSKNVVAPCLTYIFNTSLTSGVFPDDWKKARVSSIHKDGSKEDCGN